MPYPVSATRGRFSGTSVFSPLSLSPSLWLRADLGVYKDDSATQPATADGDVIAVWQDQSGNGIDVIQTNNSKRPLLKLDSNGINNLPTILFDGTDDSLEKVIADWLSSSFSGTVLAVVKLTAALKNSQSVIGSADTATSSREWSIKASETAAASKQTSYQANGDTGDYIEGSTSIVAGTTYLMVWASTGTAYQFRVNNVDQTLNVLGGSNNGDWIGDTTLRDNVSVGATHVGAAPSSFLKGSIAELLVYSPQLTAANLTSVEVYLNSRYAAF